MYELTQQMILATVICLERNCSTVAIERSFLLICISLEWCHFQFQYKDYMNTKASCFQLTLKNGPTVFVLLA